MSFPAKKLATYSDLLRLPDNVVGEIIDCALITSPRPSPRHGKAAFTLSGELFGPFQKGSSGGPGGWIFLVEPELHLNDDVLVPDIAGWRRDRLPAPPEGHGITITPDWVCEVLSPSTVRTDRVMKMPIYCNQGVQYLWLLDPLARTLEAFELAKSTWTLVGTFADQDVVRIKPFETVEISLANFWWE